MPAGLCFPSSQPVRMLRGHPGMMMMQAKGPKDKGSAAGNLAFVLETEPAHMPCSARDVCTATTPKM
jgi:hypothetical protein